MSRASDLHALPPVSNICGFCGWPKAGPPGPECEPGGEHTTSGRTRR